MIGVTQTDKRVCLAREGVVLNRSALVKGIRCTYDELLKTEGVVTPHPTQQSSHMCTAKNEHQAALQITKLTSHYIALIVKFVTLSQFAYYQFERGWRKPGGPVGNPHRQLK